MVTADSPALRRYLEEWDPAKHPRGFHGYWGHGLDHVLPHARRHGEVEHVVFRGPSGKAISANRGEHKVAKLKATARHKAGMEDRIGQRLRFGRQAAGHWYMIKGPQYWVKSDGKPGWHNGFYYWPGQSFPVTPPREDWESRTSYNGYPSTASRPGSPLSSVVPDDVLQAAQMYKDERVGKRLVGPEADKTVRSEKFAHRKARAGLGDGSIDAKPSTKYRARTVKRKAAEALHGHSPALTRMMEGQ